MSADGKWKLVISTPMGPQELTLDITTSGSTFTAKGQSVQGAQDISGTVSGDTLSWSTKVAQPMPLTLEFNVNFEGDKAAGTAKLGPFGNANVTGQRA